MYWPYNLLFRSLGYLVIEGVCFFSGEGIFVEVSWPVDSYGHVEPNSKNWENNKNIITIKIINTKIWKMTKRKSS